MPLSQPSGRRSNLTVATHSTAASCSNRLVSHRFAVAAADAARAGAMPDHNGGTGTSGVIPVHQSPIRSSTPARSDELYRARIISRGAGTMKFLLGVAGLIALAFAHSAAARTTSSAISARA